MVRLPGGAFGAPLGVAETAPDSPDSLMAPAVAVAPGGWVAAAWVQKTDQTQLAAAVIGPGGTVSTAVLDAGPLFDGPHAPARGAAVTSWTVEGFAAA